MSVILDALRGAKGSKRGKESGASATADGERVGSDVEQVLSTLGYSRGQVRFGTTSTRVLLGASAVVALLAAWLWTEWRTTPEAVPPVSARVEPSIRERVPVEPATPSARVPPTVEVPPPGPEPTPIPEPPPPSDAGGTATESPSWAADPPDPPPPSGQTDFPGGDILERDRVVRDDFVRSASLERLRDAVLRVLDEAESVTATGFSFVYVTRPRRGLLRRAPAMVFCGRYVPRVDAHSLRETWNLAVRLGHAGREVCVFLAGDGIASKRELSAAIVELRARLTRLSDTHITVLPVDVHDWRGPVPSDAPAPARKVLEGLRRGV